LQLSLHICPEEGVFINTANCKDKIEKTTDDCCKTAQPKQNLRTASLTTKPCCSDTYIFAISAKFGSISFNKIAKIHFISNELSKSTAKNNLPHPQVTLLQIHSPPIAQNPPRFMLCTWLI
jgi:tartrate dehydratase alpha subunit/fumarate hydratase class I-like protein